ncbi:nuc-1 negative regulatory protein preg [Gaeumannomyces tritici R3-111a-1]|uniref:Nuc-1 negative regulatory protein preg n=1 Tax=Gaeumannomyces tritici (strain R3-111a-1) TaxID=644352 RepID=J3PHN9_GAET3|nr:nuc-1 negative regulatory protein preg [Gaeumannomyces tritici R3-111a-1]EJT69400.1 nuc-1 negative regulatory protein preg [Gaeumannomyces tritici R3-111a-1]
MLTRSPAHPRSSNASPSFHGFHYAPALPSHHSSPSRLSVAVQRRPSASSSIAGPGSGPASSSGFGPPPELGSTPATPPTVAAAAAAPVQGAAVPAAVSPTHSASHPSAAPSKSRYVAVDAATQYSPMEPINYLATLHAKQNLHTIPTDLPPTPGPKPMTPGIEQGVEVPAPTPVSSHTSGATENGATPTAPASRIDTTPAVSAAAAKAIMSPGKRRNSQTVASASDDPATQSPIIRPKRAKSEKAPLKVLPERYELCLTEDIVVLIAHMLGELIETNDALALKSGHLTRFHSRTAPGISVLEYLHRLAKHATLSPPLLLSMVYYIDRLCALYPDFTINTLTVHRFLITAATVAAKGLSDLFWNNTTYARVGGVRVAELKLLELEFLYRVDWKIVPNPEVLVAYYKGLIERCPGYVLQGEQSPEVEDDDDEIDDDEDIDGDLEDDEER